MEAATPPRASMSAAMGSNKFERASDFVSACASRSTWCLRSCACTSSGRLPPSDGKPVATEENSVDRMNTDFILDNMKDKC